MYSTLQVYMVFASFVVYPWRRVPERLNNISLKLRAFLKGLQK
jgi:hypothetical protein